MKLIQFTKYRIDSLLKAIGMYYGIMIFVNLIFPFVITIISDNGTVSSGNSFLFATPIFALVFGIASVKEELLLGVAHGISRKTHILSFIFTIVALSVLGAIGDIICGLIESFFINIIFNSESVPFLFDALYSERTVFTSLIGSVFIHLLWKFGMLLFIGTFGYLIGSIYYRLSVFGRVVFSIVFWGGSMYLLILDATKFGWIIINHLNNIVSGGSTNNPLVFTVFTIILSLIFIAISWPVIRRSPIRTVKK